MFATPFESACRKPTFEWQLTTNQMCENLVTILAQSSIEIHGAETIT